jgi:hypothetical protein
VYEHRLAYDNFSTPGAWAGFCMTGAVGEKRIETGPMMGSIGCSDYSRIYSKDNSICLLEKQFWWLLGKWIGM